MPHCSRYLTAPSLLAVAVFSAAAQPLPTVSELHLPADIAAVLTDWNQQATALERDIALGGETLDRRTSLIRLYLDHQNGAKALPHIQAVIAALPPDAKVSQTYAGFLDELHRPADALTVWKKVLELDSKCEPAHFRVTRLLIEKGSLADALASADEGLAAAPESGRLYLAKSEILEKEGAFYESRQVLRKAAALNDPALLARLSELEDISGHAAARSYLHLAEVLEKASPQSPDYVRALKRGLEVALRDNDSQTATKCAAKLDAAGQRTGLDGSPLARRDDSTSETNNTPIPGGLEALAGIAHSASKSPPERFFTEYAKTVRANTLANDNEAKKYVAAIQQYFQVLSALESLGKREREDVRFHLSLDSKENQQQAEKILNLLGWKLRVNKDAVVLNEGEQAGQAQRQETTSALAVDEEGMQAALKVRRSFDFEIRNGRAPVLLGEETWRAAFYAKEKLAGGFAEAMARDLRIAKLYAGFSAMDKDALQSLLAGVNLKTLGDRYADLIYWYAPALAVRQGHAEVPGGIAAEPIWEKMVGPSPAKTSEFFRALIHKDEGRLLAYYAALAQLDLAHQRFFTLNQSRTVKFYEFFRRSREMATGAGNETASTGFLVFLRDVPLDEHGNVDFPGGPELWIAAKRHAIPLEQTDLKKASKAAAPAEEDEILVRLARSQYQSGQANYSELDNFMAVARIDAHRSEPLDQGSALLLADQFTENRTVYPYFACLTGLTRNQFQLFFNMSAKLKRMPEVELNSVLGEFHAIAKLLCLAEESGTLPPKQAGEIFGALADKFGSAASPADFAVASLDAVRTMLPPGAADPDQAIRAMLIGQPSPVSFDLDGAIHQTDAIARRDTDFRHVLELQRVPPLNVLYRLSDAARSLAANQGAAAENLQILETEGAALPMLEALPENLRVKARVRENLQSFETPAALAELHGLAQKTSINQKDVQRLSLDLLAQLNAHVRLALTGIVYAYYFRPSDLLASEDPLFLRKHEFVALGRPERSAPFQEPSDLKTTSEGAGSYLKGGFAGFSRMAGRVAARGPQHGRDSDMVFAAQIGSLRATDWRNIGDHAMLVFGLKVRLGREWIEHAYRNPEMLSDLEDGALGILSLGRRAHLLNALREGDWQSVWQSVTLADLYFLSDSYLARHASDPWDSPVTRYLRRVSTDRDAAQLASLGASHPDLNGCDHSHLMRLAPYEEYERIMMPTAMAERVSELKLYLLDYAGKAGIPAAALGALAEPVALEIMRKMKMADMKDWRPVALAYSSVGEDIEAVLRQP